MKKIISSLIALMFVAPAFAFAIPVSWDRFQVGGVRPLYILDTVFGNIFTATSTTQASTLPFASTTAFSFTSTSTGSNGINISAGCFAFGGVCINGGGTIGAGTTGQVAYYNATNQAVGTSTIFIDTTSFVGIATTTPGKLLTVSSDRGTSSLFELSNFSGAAAVAPTITFFKGATSSASGDLIGAFEFDTNSDTGTRGTFARIRAFDLDPTNASKDSSMYFETRNNNTLGQTLVLSSGNVGTSSTTPWGLLSVGVPDNSPTPQFVVASSSKVSLFVGPSGGISIGTSTNTGNRDLLITSDLNSATPVVQLRNWNSGNAANANFFVTNDAGGGFNEIVYGSGFSTSSLKTPNSGHFITSGALANGMVLGTSGGTAPLIFVQGGANSEIMRLFNGNLGIASTSPQSLLSIGGGNITQTSGSFSATSYADFTNVPAGMVISGKYAYVVESVAASGLEIFDLSTSTPFLISTLATVNAPIGKPVLAGNFLYVSENNNATTVQIIDVSNVVAPRIVATINTGQSGRSITISGRYLYIAATSKVFTYDISNPLNPQQLGQVTLANTSGLFGSALQGPYLYLAEGTSTAATAGFQIVDISNPTTPTLLSSYPISNAGRSIAVQGRYAYVGENVAATGIQVIDVSNPISPTLVSTFATNAALGGSFASEMVLAGNYLYVHGASGANNVQIIGTSNPAALVSVAATSSNVSASGRGMALVGKYLYDAYGNAAQGFSVYDVSGAVLPSATIGSLSTDILNVVGSATFGGNIFSNGSINAGLEGISSRGALGVFIASTTATTPTAATFQGGGVAVGTSTALWPMTLANIATTSTGSQYPQLALLDNGTNKDVWTLRNVSGNLYIATSSQIAATSTVAALFFNSNGAATFGTPATTTFTGGIDFTRFNLSATSTGSQGINLTSGCYAVNNTCLTTGAGTLGAGTTGQNAYYSNTNAVTGTSTIFTSTASTVGISSSTPFAKFAIQALSGETNSFLFLIGSSTSSTVASNALGVTRSGHIIASSTSPTLSSCGTGPAMVGSDAWGTVTPGATSNGCTVTFQVPYSAAPTCVVSPQTGSVVNTFSYSVTASALTVTETGLGTGKFDFICHGVSGTQ